MAILSGIITPTNVLTATSTNTVTNKTISGASNTVTNIPLGTAVTGTLPVANGGTGVTSPGTSGNVLTSNGTAWVSSAPVAAGLTLGTPVATTSGTAVNFTGLPSGVKQITISFRQMSISTNADILVRLGTSGGVEATSYEAVCGEFISGGTPQVTAATNGFVIRNSASELHDGAIILTLLDSTNNIWSAICNVVVRNTGVVRMLAGTKALSATLDRVQLTTATGATFDNGSVNIAYF